MNSKWILGINSAGFNTSSALLHNGKVVSAVEEERLNREKRTRKFPSKGIEWALKKASIKFEDLDCVAVAWNPAVNLEAHNVPQSGRARYLGEILYNVPSHLMALRKSDAGEVTEQTIHLENGKPIKIYYILHHLSHASNFFFSGFENAAVLTTDAFGEKNCATFSEASGSKIKKIWSQDFPHSLGAYYSTMTEFLGFAPQSDEWKLMGASSYGDYKRFYEKLKTLVAFNSDLGFELNLSYFNFYQFHRPLKYAPKLADLLGIKPNNKGVPLTQEYYDLAAGAQKLFEEIYFNLMNQLYKKTKNKNLVVSGGSALNSVGNGKIFANTPFENVFIPPVPDDSGGALGAALYVYNQILEGKSNYKMETNYLGPSYDSADCLDAINKYKIKYRESKNFSYDIAKMISEGKIIGWFQDGLEFGDRALGNRSILADPRNSSMKDKVNETVKYREGFRPFAPSILAEHIDDFFIDAKPTPFMEKVFLIKIEKRELIPAVTHVDGSGRLQTVTKEQNQKYHSLISAFKEITGIPIILNTSFNLKGEPMVCSPTDAIRTFFSSGLDALVLDKYIIEK